jgi:hypothetical protein
MFKNPCREDGSIRYFELIKIAVIAIFLIMVYAIYLESSMLMVEASLFVKFIVSILIAIQMFLSNLELYKWIISVIDLTLFNLVHISKLPFKAIVVRVYELKEILFNYGLYPTLKYRVIRI